MSNTMVGFLLGLGSAAWFYKIMYKNTGGNTKNSLIVSGIGGFIIFVIVLLTLNSIFPS